MTQTARPDSTTSDTGFTVFGGAGSIHAALNDQSDLTYAAGLGDTASGTLQNLADPLTSSGHVLNIRRFAVSGAGIGTAALYQGDPAGSGTLIVQMTLVENSTLETQSINLSGAEADAITNYNDLYWWIDDSGGGSAREFYEFWLEVPDNSVTLIGSTFQKARTFPAGSTITGGAATLIGSTLVRAGTFAKGWIGKPSHIPSAVLEMDTSELKNGARLDVDSLDSGATLDFSELTWTEDLTPYLRRGRTDRGAERELQRIDAGTAEFEIDNRTGILTDARPMLRFRLQAVWNGVFYPVISGFAEALEITFPGEGDQIITVSITDGFKILAAAIVSGDFPAQSSGERITAILEAIGWPMIFGAIDPGVVDVPAITLENVSALEHIQQIEFAEGGRFFMSRSGSATFRDRTQPAPALAERTWADDGSGMTYRDLAARKNDDLIANDVRLTRPGGVEQVAVSIDSQGRYGIRPMISEIQLATDGEVLERAQFFLNRYSEAERRIESLVDNAMRHQLWDRVLAREIADPVMVIESQIPITQALSIEGLSHEFDFSLNSWAVTLAVSPTAISVHAILDDPILGVLDAGNVLG